MGAAEDGGKGQYLICLESSDVSNVSADLQVGARPALDVLSRPHQQQQFVSCCVCYTNESFARML